MSGSKCLESPRETAAGIFGQQRPAAAGPEDQPDLEYDFVDDRTERLARLKWLPILDQYTREGLSPRVESSMTAEDFIQTLKRLVKERDPPGFIRSENGPEFFTAAVKYWIASGGMKTLRIEPGAPWDPPHSESFNSRLRDEFLTVAAFASSLKAILLGSEHRVGFHHYRLHASRGDLSPVEFAKRGLDSLQLFDLVGKASAP